MILETERLILRPFTEADAESVFEYARDERIGKGAGWLPHTSVENSREIVRCVLAVPETYAVTLKPDPKAIGSISLLIGKNSNLDLPENEAEIGFWIGAPFWGRGLIPEATRELVRHAFCDLGFQTLWGGYFEGNENSRRAQEKCGFLYHHTNKDIFWRLTGENMTEHITRLRKEDWKAAFSVRPLSQDQIAAALALARRVFEAFEAPDYGAEGTAEFRRSLSDPKYLDGIEYAGAFDGQTMIGMAGFRRKESHVCMAFVEGRYHRLGIGTKLIRFLTQEAKRKAITVNSSPFALPFYCALGFCAVEPEKTVNGIRFTPMIYRV